MHVQNGASPPLPPPLRKEGTGGAVGRGEHPEQGADQAPRGGSTQAHNQPQGTHPPNYLLCVASTSVRQQAAEEGVRLALARRRGQGRDRRLRAEWRALQVPEGARAVGAQAAGWRRVADRRAKLQLLEADARAEILPEEGQERCRVISSDTRGGAGIRPHDNACFSVVGGCAL